MSSGPSLPERGTDTHHATAWGEGDGDGGGDGGDAGSGGHGDNFA